MGTLTPLTVQSGRSTQHRESFAQFGDIVVMSNGHDAMQCRNLRNNTTFDYGMAAPAAPTAGASPGAGSVLGVILYRARWYDDSTQTYSLPSATLEVTADSIQVLINRPGSVPSRATHWILERTSNGGDVFYPVQTLAVASTTATDNESDADLEEFEALVIDENQAQPEFIPRVVFSNQGILHGVGGRIHRVNAALVNGSGTVSSGSEFTQQMDTEEQDLTVPADADGQVYKVTGYTSASQISITPSYAGANGTKQVHITGRRDRVWWSEGDNPEHGGTKRAGLTRNQAFLGDDGEPVIGGCGLGPVGVLYAKETSLYFHSYNQKPNAPAEGDGSIKKLQSRRGIVGPLALRCVNGVVYGIDKQGIWRASPGGEPDEFAARELGKLWKNGTFNFAAGDNWHIGWDPFRGWLVFFICLSGETYPTTGWIFDLRQGQWRGTLKFPLGVTCTAELPDVSGVLRMAFWLERGGVGSYHYILNDNRCQGGDPNFTLQATCHGGDVNTIFNTDATFKTTGAGCKGLQVWKVNTNDGTIERRIVASNDAVTLTVTQNWDVQPTGPGLRIVLAPIESIYRSGRIFAGEPLKRKKFSAVWITLAVCPALRSLYMETYYEGRSTAANNPETKTEDGVVQTAGSPVTQLTFSGEATTRRIRVPLHGPATGTDATRWATDLEIKLYSYEPDATAWEVMDMEVEYETEEKISKDAA